MHSEGSQEESVDMIYEVGRSDWHGKIKGAMLFETHLVRRPKRIGHMVLYKYLKGINTIRRENIFYSRVGHKN